MGFACCASDPAGPIVVGESPARSQASQSHSPRERNSVGAQTHFGAETRLSGVSTESSRLLRPTWGPKRGSAG